MGSWVCTVPYDPCCFVSGTVFNSAFADAVSPVIVRFLRGDVLLRDTALCEPHGGVVVVRGLLSNEGVEQSAEIRHKICRGTGGDSFRRVGKNAKDQVVVGDGSQGYMELRRRGRF